jgi:hypothetical protein
VFYYVKILPWLAWPALPLAAWAVWEARKKVWHQAEFQLLLSQLHRHANHPEHRAGHQGCVRLPMLMPISLLATASLSTLRRGAANALDWFGIMTFALLAIAFWWGWAGLLLDNNAWITHQFKDYQPGFEPDFNAIPFWIAFTHHPGCGLYWCGASVVPCAVRSSTGPPALPCCGYSS